MLQLLNVTNGRDDVPEFSQSTTKDVTHLKLKRAKAEASEVGTIVNKSGRFS